MLNDAKANKLPIMGLDLLRAKCFLAMNQPPSAIQSLYEELRYFPDNQEAQNILNQLLAQHPEFSATQIEDPEFTELLQQIQPYTMLSEARLYSLFNLTKKICQENIGGNFVECGVAAGGSTALMAAVIKRYSQQPRFIYSFDSFDGMPSPTEKDVSGGVDANSMGWGTGTCAAPEASVTQICQRLGVFDVVHLIKGYFEDTLPVNKEQLGSIAFLHMDGDWYSSTQAILTNLYDRISPQGYVQIDDYGFWEGCRQAVSEFQQERNLEFNLQVIDSTGVWFALSDVNHLKTNKEITSKKKWLNLGCGQCFHADWTNLDFTASSEQVIAHNLLTGIPFEDESFEVVYHSHLLEHLPKSQVELFLQGCYRVLKPEGIIRVVVPDLEQIARLYLSSLEKALAGDASAQANYDWMMLEMYDQVVRNQSGGEMIRYLSQDVVPNQDFIVERLGVEGEKMLEMMKGKNYVPVPDTQLNPEQIGRFRLGGEIHQWMYDRYSLSMLLQKVGFQEIQICTAEESRIPDFAQYNLDVLDGRVRKNDSLFMEARK